LRFEGITRRLEEYKIRKNPMEKTREQTRCLNTTQQLRVRISVCWIWRRLVFLEGSRRSSFAFLGVDVGVKNSFAFLGVDEGVKISFAFLGVDEGVKNSFAFLGVDEGVKYLCFPWCG
jgi:hypothetical protein